MNLESHAHKLVNLTDPNQAKQILRAIGSNVLQEVKDLPKTATPDWLELWKTLTREGSLSQKRTSKSQIGYFSLQGMISVSPRRSGDISMTPPSRTMGCRRRSCYARAESRNHVGKNSSTHGLVEEVSISQDGARS